MKRNKFPLSTRLEIWESGYGRYKEWVLEKGGLPIAKLKFVQNPEVYWDLYETTITTDDSTLRQNMLTSEFWEKTSHSELVWRNDYFKCSTRIATAILHKVVSADKIMLQLRYLSIDDIETPLLYEKILLWMRRAFKLNKYSNVISSKWRRNSYKTGERLEIWEANYGRSKGWFVEKSGQRIAELRYLQTPDMFWDLYETTITTSDPTLRQRMLTAEFWEREAYEDLGWRNSYFDFYTQFAAPVLHKVESSDKIILQIRYLYIQNIGFPKMHEKALLWWRKAFKEARSSKMTAALLI